MIIKLRVGCLCLSYQHRDPKKTLTPSHCFIQDRAIDIPLSLITRTEEHGAGFMSR